MVVIKKDGSRQSFDRNKVLSGLIRACEKRPVPYHILATVQHLPLRASSGPAGVVKAKTSL